MMRGLGKNGLSVPVPAAAIAAVAVVVVAGIAAATVAAAAGIADLPSRVQPSRGETDAPGKRQAGSMRPFLRHRTQRVLPRAHPGARFPRVPFNSFRASLPWKVSAIETIENWSCRENKLLGNQACQKIGDGYDGGETSGCGSMVE